MRTGKTDRNRRIALDFAHGIKRSVLADREGVSSARLDQIIWAAAKSVGMHPSGMVAEPWRFRERYLAAIRRSYRAFEASTPEDFYFELMHEPRTYTA